VRKDKVMSKKIKKSIVIEQKNNPNTEDLKEFSYVVISAKNTTKPRVYEWLKEHEVQRLIVEGMDVTIRGEK
jgi:hypothetical protein